MKTVMGIINLQEDNSLIRELTDRRVVESLPFAGRCRLIDFALSSMVNSGECDESTPSLRKIRPIS